MNLFLLIVGDILICFLIFSITKDFLHPGFLFCIPWIVFLTLLALSNYDYDGSSLCYIYFLIGTIFFEIGCFLGQRKIKKDERLVDNHNQIYYINYHVIKFIMCIECAFILFLLFYYYSFMRSHFTTNIFLTFHTNRYEMAYGGFIGYGRNIFSAFGICMVVGYSHIPLADRTKYKKYLGAQSLMYLIMTVTRVTRNEMLFAVLPFFMAFIVVTKLKNLQVFKIMIVAVILFFILFGVIAVMKYTTIFSNGDYLEEIFNQIVLYGSGGFVAFQKKFDAMNFLQYGGSNTFRFFQAIIDKVAGTDFAMPLVQEFSSIGIGKTTNVYTFYQWYANDFGIIYALFMQYFIGILHGFSYKKMSQMKIYGIYMYCMLMHPLIMQIFQDQYFSLMSTWIQYFLVGFIFLKTDILFSRSAKRDALHVYI